jgi:hypothetical protein
MTLTRSQKILVGFFTLWPPVYFMLFFCFILLTMGSIFLGAVSGTDSPVPFLAPFGFIPLIFIFHFLTILVIWGLIAFYIIYLFKSDRIPQEKKVLWLVLMILLGLFTMPIFYYFYIWPES